MLERDDRIPTKTFDSYWIIAVNEKRNYKVKSGRTGKWLIFEHRSELDKTWDIIKEATRNGKLGHESKTATAKINPNAQNPDIKVICVYTADFDNTEDLTRIEQNIRSLGIINKLTYKLDKDVGKYQSQGHKNLSQKISYSDKYFEVRRWLAKKSTSKYIRQVESNAHNKKRYLFQRLDMDKEVYQSKRLILEKLGFFFEKGSEVKDEEAFFLV